MFTLCSAKDTIFTAALLMLLLALIDLGSDSGRFLLPGIRWRFLY